MVVSFPHLILTFTITFHLCTTTTSANTLPRTRALVMQLHKDDTTLQRIIKINQRTPPVTIPLTVDLGGKLLWVDCDHGYHSSTYRKIHCSSARCALVNSNCSKSCNVPYKPPCTKTSCTLDLTSPFNNKAIVGQLSSDLIRINSTDGSNPLRVVSVPNLLIGCSSTTLLQGIAQGVQGIAGVGKSKISLQTQFSSSFQFANIFAVCASSSSFTDGFIIFGDKPYNLDPGLDTSTLLSYTPLVVNPVTPSEYFIGVTDIKLDKKSLPINKTLLRINRNGFGGTKISTVRPYTIIQSSILKAITKAFTAQVERPGSFAFRVKAIPPFQVCYKAGSLPVDRIGVIVPDINLVLQSVNVVWTISRSNSMVALNNYNAYCLGLIDGGSNPKTTIVIGSYQLENNLVQFDLTRSRLGFSNTLFNSRTRCDNFNFTTA